jgi:Ubiquitin fusion degradation protein UFD1
MAEQDSLRWSSSFVVSHSSVLSALRGDKIILPQTALEQLLAEAPTSTTSGTSTAFDPRNPYSVAAARRERSLYAETTPHLPNPLMFRLVNEANGKEVYAGIREFSSTEGELGLSPYLMDALELLGAQHLDGVSAGTAIDVDSEVMAALALPRVTVQAQQLPKGNYVRLRPLEAGYNPDDWKSLLERELRNSYTTLTKDTILSVRGVKGEEFRFLVDKLLPDGNGICVVDTDLEVDIEALNEEQARETMRQIIAKAQSGTENGSSRGGEIDIWTNVDGQVLPGEYVDYELASWDRSRAVSVEVSPINPQDEDVIDLFVSPRSRLHRSRPRHDEHVLGNVSAAEDGVKAITIQPTNVALDDAEKLLISVRGYLPSKDSPLDLKPLLYKLRARVGAAQECNDRQPTRDGAQDTSKDELQCKNCLQWVPKRTMVLHENFCLRNNISCPQCKKVFKISSKEWQSHWHCPHDDGNGNSAVR